MLGKKIKFSNKEIVSVVGAGGKTSFINYFAQYYKDKRNVLLTTTTHIFVPNKEMYENIYMTRDNQKIISNSLNGITVCGKYINDKNKIVGLDFENIDNIYDKFELILIEADGSKMKKIKGWNDTEPVIYPKSTKTIGILDITAYDMDINEENVHRLELFKDITLATESKINLEHLKRIVLNEKGIFKNAVGEKILFINKVECNKYEELTKKLIELINEENHNIRIFYGSVKKGYCKNEK